MRRVNQTEKMFRKLQLPSIGMRKVKSLLAILIGFIIWQGIRLFFPDLDPHPLFIYLYGFLEIRDSSDKTKELGKQRIKVTLIAMVIALPMLLLRIFLHNKIQAQWTEICIDLVMVLVGVLLSFELGEKMKCGAMTGLTAAIFVILFLYHADDDRYLYTALRATQTIIGVFVAWLVNVLIFPYPGKITNKE